MAEWFEQKRYGIGSGKPITWQGWLVTVGYIAIVLGAAALFATQPAILFGIIIPITAALLIVTARTTRGGWRWRWGDKD